MAEPFVGTTVDERGVRDFILTYSFNLTILKLLAADAIGHVIGGRSAERWAHASVFLECSLVGIRLFLCSYKIKACRNLVIDMPYGGIVLYTVRRESIAIWCMKSCAGEQVRRRVETVTASNFDRHECRAG